MFFLSLGFIYFFNLLDFYPVTRFLVTALLVSRYCVNLFSNTRSTTRFRQGGHGSGPVNLLYLGIMDNRWNFFNFETLETHCNLIFNRIKSFLEY